MGKKSRGGCGTIINLIGLIVAVAAIGIGITNEEIRCQLGLECPEESYPLFGASGPSLLESIDFSDGRYTLALCEVEALNEGSLTFQDLLSMIRTQLNDNNIIYNGIEQVDDLTIIIEGVDSQFAINQALQARTVTGLDESTLCR